MAQVQQEAKKKKSPGREALEWVLWLGAAVIVGLSIRAFVFELIWVDGNSMLETLHNKEVMLVTKLEYLGSGPERFDVVICRYPNRKENFVKRVVGLPGDTIQVEGGLLYVNGEAQEEPYITHRPNYAFGPYTVQEGEYFVLGDNRSNSNDSHLVGPLKRNQIVGHVRTVLYPLDSIRGIE